MSTTPLPLIIIPIVVIAVIFIVMIPITKKMGKKTTQEANAFMSKNLPIHIFLVAGNMNAINNTPATELINYAHIYGWETPGPVDVSFFPNFTHANTHYTGKTPVHISFNTETGRSYSIDIDPRNPKKDSTVIATIPLKDDALLFKSTFYVVVKDITDDQMAKSMRGIY